MRHSYNPASLVPGLVFAAAMVLGGAVNAADALRIGFHAPLTGFAAGDGKSSSLGAELAAEQINAAGGCDGRLVELVIYDDQAKADQAIPAANKLLGEGVKVAISGSYSGATRAAAGVFQKAGIPFISAYAIHPDITRTGDHVFRTSFMGEVQGRAGAKFVGEMLGHQRVVMITLNADFGIDVVSEYSYSIKDRQFGSIVAGVKRDAPDAIYASGYFFTAGPLVSQLRAGGVEASIIGQEGYDTQHFIDIAKDAAEGVMITTSLNRDSENPEMRAFIDAFEAKAGFPADMVAAATHTAVRVMCDAVARAGSEDPGAVREALAATKDFATATGRISFNALGEIMKDVEIQIVKDGAYRHFASIHDPEFLAPPSE